MVKSAKKPLNKGLSGQYELQGVKLLLEVITHEMSQICRTKKSGQIPVDPAIFNARLGGNINCHTPIGVSAPSSSSLMMDSNFARSLSVNVVFPNVILSLFAPYNSAIFHIDCSMDGTASLYVS